MTLPYPLPSVPSNALSLDDSILDIVAGNDDFSILAAALDATGLTTAALTGEGPFTVLAPNNGAFTALMAALDLSLSDLLSIPDLKSILLYHVVSGYFTTSDLAQDIYSELTTLNGQSVSMHSVSSGLSVVDAQGAAANVFIGDIVARNGVVHGVEAVLVPLFDSVLSIAANFPAFTVLVAAVQTANLDDELADPRASFTVFAPNNDAFFALIRSLGVSLQDILSMPRDSLDSILLHHVLGTELTATQIAAKEGDDVMALNGQSISFQLDTDGIALVDAQVSVLTLHSECILTLYSL